MKKSVMILASLMIALCACADRHQMIEYAQLPVQAQAFVQKYFNQADVAYIEREHDNLQLEYNVHMKDATEIDFDREGHLKSVDCQRKALPDGIVPTLIMQYVGLHHPKQIVTEYVIDYRTQKVELNNEIELIFDMEGHFLRMDD